MKKLLSIILAGLTCLNMGLTVFAQEPTDNTENNIPPVEEPVDDGSDDNAVPADPKSLVAPCDDSLPGGSNECP